LICPCNATFDHGATYDYCRVTLVFDIGEGEIEDIVPFGVESGEPVRFAGMFHPVASDLTIAGATRSDINAFGIQYEGKTGLSTSEFSWAA
jgi:hypothetical protein